MPHQAVTTLKKSPPAFHNPLQSSVDMRLMAPSEAPWLSQLDISSHLGGWSWDFMENCIVAHEAIFDLFQICHSVGESRLSTWLERIHPADRSSLLQSFRDFVFRDNQIDTIFRLGWDKNERWLQLLGYLTRGKDGQPLSASGVVIDTTYHCRLATETLYEISERQSSISYDLTDELGQQLSGILIRAEMIQEDLPGDTSTLTERLGDVIESIRSAQVFTRQLSHKATTALVGTSELVDKLEVLTQVISDRQNVSCTFQLSGDPPKSNDFTASQIYLMAENGLDLLLKDPTIDEVHLTLQTEGNNSILSFRVDGNFADMALESQPLFDKLKRRIQLLDGVISVRHQAPAVIRCAF